jgi:hypothetical protein
MKDLHAYLYQALQADELCSIVESKYLANTLKFEGDDLLGVDFPSNFNNWIVTQIHQADKACIKPSSELTGSTARISLLKDDRNSPSWISPVAHQRGRINAVDTAKRSSCIYALLVQGNYIPVVDFVVLLCNAMRLAYLFPSTSAKGEAFLFPNGSCLVSFTCDLISRLVSVIKGFGSDMLSEVVRFGNSMEQCRNWPILAELQASVEPWDIGNEGILPHFLNARENGNGVFQRSIHEDNESKLDHTTKVSCY